MSIRYHLVYLAIGCLLGVLSVYHHYIFIVLMLLYFVFVYLRLGWKYIFMIVVLICCIGLFQSPKTWHDEIEGRIIFVSQSYCVVKTQYGNIKMYHDHDFEFQDEIQARVSLLAASTKKNDYAKDENQDLRAKKIAYKVKLEKLFRQQHHYGLYHWIEGQLSDNSLIQAYQRLFLFGEKTEQIDNDYQLLIGQNLIYLFALSGMHIQILSSVLEKGLLPMTGKYTSFIIFIMIGVYVFSIPMQISLYRAYFCLLLYRLLKRWFHRLDILSLLVIVSLIYNPYIIENKAFQFSYFIYFIVLLTSGMTGSSFFIYLAGLPLNLSMQYQIPLVSFGLGWLLTPFMQLCYVLSWLCLFISYFQNILKLLILSLQSLLSLLLKYQLIFHLSVPTLAFVVIFYYLYFYMLYQKQMRFSYRKTALMLLSLIISFMIYSRYKIYGEVTMIDVGQGDCTLIRLPMNQGNILIDTGGQKDYDLATRTIIPYLRAVGISSLDYVYISHNDFDHCGALESLQRNFPIKHVIKEYEKYRKIGCMEVEMLKTDKSYDNDNDRSLVMKVSLPAMNILFTGDISKEVEKDLLKTYHHLDVDVLKVSHHGSQSASSVELFDLISPRIAMIGVKKNNMYHHPSIDVIERLKRKNICILRTDLDGMFHIRFYGKSRYILK